MAVIRILFLSDTHLGFDQPARPRVERRRRGPDFFAAMETALAAARTLQVDAVVHGGDLFFRSRISLHLAHRGLAPLLALADEGFPVLLVPGNHERSRIPRSLLACHPNLLIFDRPRTFTLMLRDQAVSFAGFPFEPGDVRSRFPQLVEQTGMDPGAALALLCIHQVVEGAQVGPGNYIFRSGEQVIRGADLPHGFHAVLAGHVHRAQVLVQDLAGRPLASPVIYAGSTERTSFAEMNETKGYFLLEWDTAEQSLHWRFNPLPVRPMLRLRCEVSADHAETVGRLQTELARLDPQSVVQIELPGEPGSGGLTEAAVRRIAPPTMNVTLRWRLPRSGRP